MLFGYPIHKVIAYLCIGVNMNNTFLNAFGPNFQPGKVCLDRDAVMKAMRTRLGDLSMSSSHPPTFVVRGSHGLDPLAQR